MPFHGNVRDFGAVLTGAGPAGTTAAKLDGVLGYSAAPVEQGIDGGTKVSTGGGPAKPFRGTAAYLSSPGKEEIREIALPATPEAMYPAVRDREAGEQFRQDTLERIGERGLHLVHGERCLVASRSEGTCSSLAWFSLVWRSRSIRFR